MGTCVWLDVETGGLNAKTDALLEIGIIITDHNLKERKTWRGVATTRQSGVIGDYARKMHEASGLLAECEAVTTTPQALCHEAGAFLSGLGLVPNCGPMFGSSVHFDRTFLTAYDPELVKLFAYRNVDVSSLKETCTLIGIPDPSADWPKAHTALADIRRSIKEYDHYLRLMREGWGEPAWKRAALEGLEGWAKARSMMKADQPA